MQALAPVLEYLPAAHGEAADRPTAAQVKPDGQAEQEVEPMVDCKVLTAQAVHAVAPKTEYEPAAHAPETTESPVPEQ